MEHSCSLLQEFDEEPVGDEQEAGRYLLDRIQFRFCQLCEPQEAQQPGDFKDIVNDYSYMIEHRFHLPSY